LVLGVEEEVYCLLVEEEVYYRNDFHLFSTGAGTGWFDKLSEADRAKRSSLTSTSRLIGE